MFVSSHCPHVGVETFSHGGQPLKKRKEKRRFLTVSVFASLTLGNAKVLNFHVVINIGKRGPSTVPEPLDAS